MTGEVIAGHGPVIAGLTGNLSAAAFAPAIALWREWNAKINVISRKDEDNIYAHHILHSLAIYEYLQRHYVFQVGQNSSHLEQNRPFLSPVGQKSAHLEHGAVAPEGRATRGTEAGGPSRRDGGVSEANSRRGKQPPVAILDLGTGGGFPGIPLAIAMPEAQFTLCDSIGKKVRVAQAVAEGLGLKNVKCVQARAEELPGSWDWVVSRAVTSLENLYPWVKGRFRRSIICLKGGDVASEIDALQKRFKIPAENIRVWPISEWLPDDPYYAEKFVVEISAQAL